MNKQELIEYCESLKGSLNKFINGIDVNKIIKKIEQLDEPQKPVVPQFVGDWIEYCKNTDVTLVRALLVEKVDLYNYANQKDSRKLKESLKAKEKQEVFARAWLDGYEVEKEKRYRVKLKGIKSDKCYLNCVGNARNWIIGNDEGYAHIIVEHTRKELEDSGFGEVFDSPLFEVEEVAE